MWFLHQNLKWKHWKWFENKIRKRKNTYIQDIWHAKCDLEKKFSSEFSCFCYLHAQTNVQLVDLDLDAISCARSSIRWFSEVIFSVFTILCLNNFETPSCNVFHLCRLVDFDHRWIIGDMNWWWRSWCCFRAIFGHGRELFWSFGDNLRLFASSPSKTFPFYFQANLFLLGFQFFKQNKLSRINIAEKRNAKRIPSNVIKRKCNSFGQFILMFCSLVFVCVKCT